MNYYLAKITVWKFQNFSVIQILREINTRDSRSCKKCLFCHFRASEYCGFGQFQPSKSAKLNKTQNSEPPIVF